MINIIIAKAASHNHQRDVKNQYAAPSQTLFPDRVSRVMDSYQAQREPSNLKESHVASNANLTQSLPQRTWALPNALSLTRLQRFRVIGSSARTEGGAAGIITFSSCTRTTVVLAPPPKLALELATLPKSIIAMGAAAAASSLLAPLIAESLLLSSSTLLLLLLLLLLLAPAHR